MRYWQKLLILLAAMTCTVLAILVWFSWYTYSIQSESTLHTLDREASKIDNTLTDTIDHTASIMRLIAMQIKANPDDLDYISGILSQYRSNPNLYDVLSWTVFSWSNAKHLKTVDSMFGILPKPFDMSVRTYIPLVMKEPGKIQLGKPAMGYTTARYVIPAGLGVADDSGNYIGAVTIGFDIEYLTNTLKKVLDAVGIDFALIDKDSELILYNSENQIPFDKTTHKVTGEVGLFLKKLNPNATKGVIYSEIHLFGDKDSFCFYQITKYPYIIYIKYNKDIIRQNLWNALTSRLVEVLGIAFTAVMLLIAFYRHEVRLRGEADDAHEQVRQMNASLEELVARRTFELEKALKVKTEFLNNISHEVRTPIQGVIAFSNSLVDDWKSWTDIQRFDLAFKTRASAERLYSFVNDVLDLSKMEAGKMMFEMQPRDLKNSVQTIIQECLPLVINKDVVLEYVPHGDKLIVEFDEIRIGQVIRNLLANAIKFTAEGTITLKVEKGKVIYGDGRKVAGASFTIHDQGIGIPEDEIKEIFNPFHQSSRTKTKAGGTGLGLSIVREIIHVHHGRIWAENNPDKGTTFTFTIPLKQPRKKNDPNTPKGVTMFINVLMIDDERICLEMMQFILHGTKFHLITAQGGTDGLRYLNENPLAVDIVLLDMMMPDMHGLEVLTEIRNNPQFHALPVIIQSGVASDEEFKQASEIGATFFIRKPYKKAELLAVLEELTKHISVVKKTSIM